MKVIFKVEQSDLVGDIKDFPIEVVEKMIMEQVKQDNIPNVEVFQKCATLDDEDGGFTWKHTEDGDEFWKEVIVESNFDLFFEKYPKKPELVYIIGDSEIGMDIIKTLEKHGGYNLHGYEGDSDDAIYYIDPDSNYIEICSLDGRDKNFCKVLLRTYTCIEAERSVLEVTMAEVAEKFGVAVENLRIKE